VPRCIFKQHLEKSSSFVRVIIISYLLIQGHSACAQKHFDFSNGCRQAYGEIIQLRLDAGLAILDSEKKKDPDNLIPWFLENYIDFFVLFFDEDPAEYKSGLAGRTTRQFHRPRRESGAELSPRAYL
jgi:hypothetical protein